MRVYLDENVCDVHADSVATAVNAAAALARGCGRTITDVIVDGRRWPADQLAAELASSTGAAKEVRLTSADERSLVCQTLADASAALVEVDHLQRKAAEGLQGGNAAQAMADLAQAIETWSSVHQAVVLSAQAAKLDLTRNEKTIARLVNQLRTLRNGLEQRDVASLADTLMYDLPEVVSEWRALLHDLGERVRNTKG